MVLSGVYGVLKELKLYHDYLSVVDDKQHDHEVIADAIDKYGNDAGVVLRWVFQYGSIIHAQQAAIQYIDAANAYLEKGYATDGELTEFTCNMEDLGMWPLYKFWLVTYKK